MFPDLEWSAESSTAIASLTSPSTPSSLPTPSTRTGETKIINGKQLRAGTSSFVDCSPQGLEQY